VRALVDERFNGGSISLDDEVKEWIEEAAQAKGVSNSEIANDFLKRYLAGDEKGRSVVKGECLPVVLKIPVELKGNRKELAAWLQARAQFILDKLT
jgi:hypothetical protein